MQVIKGKIKSDLKTKDLVKKIQPGEIALINHKDLDEVAAQSLLEKRVRAVINTESSISGRYPNLGPSVLLNSGITLLDETNKDIWDKITDGNEVLIQEDNIYYQQNKIASGKNLHKKVVEKKLQEAKENFDYEIENFAHNTLYYANKELQIIMRGLFLPPLKTPLYDRQCLIVVRGQNYKKDLGAIKPYIYEKHPVIIGVDGGADAVLEEGLFPDIIIGDMDSVSDKALTCGAELIVHAYTNGKSPGLERIKKLGLKSWLLPAPGTSEDVAMLLAYEKKVSLIVAVGSHSNIIDFLEKGRKGMGSTFLVRLKVGNILVDARGVSELYKQKVKAKYLLEIFVAAFIPFSIVFFTSPPAFQLLKLLIIKFKLLINF